MLTQPIFVRAAELLGKDRRVNMWQNDGPSNAVVIVQPPACVMEKLMHVIQATQLDDERTLLTE